MTRVERADEKWEYESDTEDEERMGEAMDGNLRRMHRGEREGKRKGVKEE